MLNINNIFQKLNFWCFIFLFFYRELFIVFEIVNARESIKSDSGPAVPLPTMIIISSALCYSTYRIGTLKNRICNTILDSRQSQPHRRSSAGSHELWHDAFLSAACSKKESRQPQEMDCGHMQRRCSWHFSLIKGDILATVVWIQTIFDPFETKNTGSGPILPVSTT